MQPQPEAWHALVALGQVLHGCAGISAVFPWSLRPLCPPSTSSSQCPLHRLSLGMHLPGTCFGRAAHIPHSVAVQTCWGRTGGTADPKWPEKTAFQHRIETRGRHPSDQFSRPRLWCTTVSRAVDVAKRHKRLLRWICGTSGQEEEVAQHTQKNITLKMGAQVLAKDLLHWALHAPCYLFSSEDEPLSEAHLPCRC